MRRKLQLTLRFEQGDRRARRALVQGAVVESKSRFSLSGCVCCEAKLVSDTFRDSEQLGKLQKHVV